MKKQPYYACFSVKIGIFANRSLSLTKRSTGRGYFPSDIALYDKVEFILMNMEQTRAKARTFTIHVCNCMIINGHHGHAGLENMS